MASTALALKRTSKGQALGPIGSERRRQSSPPPHRLGTTGGEVTWPDSLFYHFRVMVPSTALTVPSFWRPFQRKPTGEGGGQGLGAWLSSKLPGVLRHPNPGKARLSRDKDCAEGGSLPRDNRSADTRGGSLATSAIKVTCLFCGDLSDSESAGKDESALDRSGGRGTRPLLMKLQPPKALCSKTSAPCRPRELEGGGWPIWTGPAILPWEAQLPGSPRSSKAKR